jgi:hypothetical protein
MSLLKHVEENAEHLLKLVKHMMQVEMNMYGTALDVTAKMHDVLEAHVNPPMATVVSNPNPIPVVSVAAPTSVTTVAASAAPTIVS